MSSTTVIAQFYNEEYLLPWWLRHHTHYFSHGILINRNSTDRSVDICRQLAPHWELRNARVNIFDAAENDQEIMEVESGVSGWKIVLNITEFFCCRNMLGICREDGRGRILDVSITRICDGGLPECTKSQSRSPSAPGRTKTSWLWR